MRLLTALLVTGLGTRPGASAQIDLDTLTNATRPVKIPFATPTPG